LDETQLAELDFEDDAQDGTASAANERGPLPAAGTAAPAAQDDSLAAFLRGLDNNNGPETKPPS